MPIPYVQECQESMNAVATAKSTITDAIKAIRDYADSDTWSGNPATNFMTDLEGHLSAAEAALGGPLDAAERECLKHAHELQVKSGQAAGNPGG